MGLVDKKHRTTVDICFSTLMVKSRSVRSIAILYSYVNSLYIIRGKKVIHVSKIIVCAVFTIPTFLNENTLILLLDHDLFVIMNENHFLWKYICLSSLIFTSIRLSISSFKTSIAK